MNKPLLPPMPPLLDQEIAIAIQNSRQGKRRTFRRTLAELAVLFSVIIILAVGYYRETRLPFNSAQWKAARHEVKTIYSFLSTRGKMCDDLIPKLQGLHESQVRALLGEPDVVNEKGGSLKYKVGYSMIDPIYLVIELDSKKNVIESYVETSA